jgi:hypothetical protein
VRSHQDAGAGAERERHAERWVRTPRSDCPDRCLILSGRHLDHLLRVYREHYTGIGRTARSP